MGIHIVYANPKIGKTSYITFRGIEHAFDTARYREMKKEIEKLKANGFRNLTIPETLLSAPYDIQIKKFGYTTRHNRIIDPAHLGLYHGDGKDDWVHFNVPHEVILVPEAQNYFYSKDGPLPRWKGHWFEISGHNDLEIYLDTQRPFNIHKDIRGMATIENILSCESFYDSMGGFIKTQWRIHRFKNNILFEEFERSGGQNKKLYEEDTVTTNINVFNCFDYKGERKEFYRGHLNQDFDVKYSTAKNIDSWDILFNEFNKGAIKDVVR